MLSCLNRFIVDVCDHSGDAMNSLQFKNRRVFRREEMYQILFGSLVVENNVQVVDWLTMDCYMQFAGPKGKGKRGRPRA